MRNSKRKFPFNLVQKNFNLIQVIEALGFMAICRDLRNKYMALSLCTARANIAIFLIVIISNKIQTKINYSKFVKCAQILKL